MAAILEVKYFNSFWSKKITTGPIPTYTHYSQSTYGSCCYPGPVNVGDAINGLNDFGAAGNGWPSGEDSKYLNVLASNFYIEESRIKGEFNAPSVDLGVRAYLNEEDPSQQHRQNALIYSGLFNSLTNFNETNVFSIGEVITKAVDPVYGSIQKLHSDDTNLLILQENKSSYALIDKDAIYSAEGSGTPVSSQTVVIGQVVPYLGEYGISQNPESFATFGFQKYYVDKDRSAVMRLSRDGLTEISNYGMLDYFRDELALVDNSFKLYDCDVYHSGTINTNVFTVQTTNGRIELGAGIYVSTDCINFTDTGAFIDKVVKVNSNTFTITSNIAINKTNDCTTIKFKSYKKGQIVGGYDVYSKHYMLSMQQMPAFYSTELSTYQTLSFDESINGWPSRYTFKPSQALSLENTFYTTDKNGDLYLQFDDSVANRRGYFYTQAHSPATVQFIMNAQPSLVKVFQTVAYEGSNGWQVESFYSDEEGPDYRSTGYTNYDDESQFVYSLLKGTYEINTPTNTGTSAISPPFGYAGFNRKENKYVANLVQKKTTTSGTISYPPRPGEIIFGSDMTGIKGFYTTVKLSTDDVTEVGGMKELFAAASNVVMSS